MSGRPSKYLRWLAIQFKFWKLFLHIFAVTLSYSQRTDLNRNTKRNRSNPIQSNLTQKNLSLRYSIHLTSPSSLCFFGSFRHLTGFRATPKLVFCRLRSSIICSFRPGNCSQLLAVHWFRGCQTLRYKKIQQTWDGSYVSSQNRSSYCWTSRTPKKRPHQFYMLHIWSCIYWSSMYFL